MSETVTFFRERKKNIWNGNLFQHPLPPPPTPYPTPPYLPNQSFSKARHQRDPEFARKDSSQTKFRKTALKFGERTAPSCSTTRRNKLEKKGNEEIRLFFFFCICYVRNGYFLSKKKEKYLEWKSFPTSSSASRYPLRTLPSESILLKRASSKESRGRKKRIPNEIPENCSEIRRANGPVLFESHSILTGVPFRSTEIRI
ncbi:hypothetical protein CEXT_27621 [Caerostris extrusa]|uniref:Uncharacterized protein n=1 Tax=Caerostris extrusa TaxID=172846 RepID=A0AAV4UYP3_CAEEX|nr:hypothetical protein CEXT_27621 [Caerostris extrusa]